MASTNSKPCALSAVYLKTAKMAKLLVFSLMTHLIYQKQSMVEKLKINAYLVPDIISKDTFNGEHISEYKRRQIQQQEKLLTPTIADESQLKPMEP